MKQIIRGKKYDTTKAKKIADDFVREGRETSLYRTPKATRNKGGLENSSERRIRMKKKCKVCKKEFEESDPSIFFEATSEEKPICEDCLIESSDQGCEITTL